MFGFSNRSQSKEQDQLAREIDASLADSFCLTILVPIYSKTDVIGVLGADISFADLLHI
jgi:hypothetical protein